MLKPILRWSKGPLFLSMNQLVSDILCNNKAFIHLFHTVQFGGNKKTVKHLIQNLRPLQFSAPYARCGQKGPQMPESYWSQPKTNLREPLLLENKMKLNKMYAKKYAISKLEENRRLPLPRDCITHLSKNSWNKKRLIQIWGCVFA